MNISYLAMSDIPSKNANSLQIVQMCNAFIENGNKVKLVAPCFDHTENISVKNYYGIKNKIQIIRIGKKRKDLSKLDNIIFPLRLALYSLFNKNNLFITRNIIVSFFLIIFRIKHILELHDDLEIAGKKISKIFKNLKLLNSNKIIKIIFITKSLHNFISSKYNYKKKNYRILSDASSLKIKPEKLVSKKKINIGYFGSVYNSRGTQFIIKLSKIDNKNDYFIFGGKKNDLDKIKLKHRSKNLHLHEQIPYSEISHHLKKMDILLMPYSKIVTSTGNIGNIAKFMSPMKMFDYLASGKLIISSDIPVLREILKHQYNAILIKNYENIFEWKKYIDNFNFNLYKFMIIKKNAQQTVRDLTWINRAKKMINLDQ